MAFLRLIQMGDSGKLPDMKTKNIPSKVWNNVLSTLKTPDRANFYETRRHHRYIPNSSLEKTWISYIRSEPPPEELAEKIIEKVISYELLCHILCISRRANPSLRKETTPVTSYGHCLA